MQKPLQAQVPQWNMQPTPQQEANQKLALMANRAPLNTMAAHGKGEMKQVKGTAVNQMNKFFQSEMQVAPQQKQPMGFGAKQMPAMAAPQLKQRQMLTPSKLPSKSPMPLMAPSMQKAPTMKFPMAPPKQPISAKQSLFQRLDARSLG